MSPTADSLFTLVSVSVRKIAGRLWTTLRQSVRESNATWSPSHYHRQLADQLVPALTYQGGEVAAWQNQLRPVLARLLAETPFPSGPTQVQSLWTRLVPLGTIEKLVLRGDLGADVPAYLCLPRAGKPPHPVMVCLQGHSSGMHNSIGVARWNEERPIEVAGDRDLALGCLSRGVAALCIEQRGLGERAEQTNRWQKLTWHECTEAAMHGILMGQTLLGQRVRDVDRGLDLLEARGLFDMRRVGVMGQSGGGTVAVYAAALLSRVQLAVASCAFCSFRDSLLTRLHCPDNYVPGILRTCELADVLGLAAPRPVVVVAGRQDPIFPFAGFETAAAQLRRIYAAAGAAEHCRVVACEGGHRFDARATWEQLLPYLRP